MAAEAWDSGDAYERYVGRWSRKVATEFPICQPGPLRALFETTALKSVLVRAIDIPTVFHSFDDYWTPFLGGAGTAPNYLASVGGDVRDRIRLCLKARLASTHDGPIELTARAWAVQGVV